MTMHPTPAERLLAMLEEDASVETLPAQEVRDGLAALGVNPARSISFARSLAGGGDSPGGRLMGALLAGEEEEDEIARIEAADIDEVKARVAGGAAAAIAAEARRKAGLKDNVVGLAEKRRKRRRLIVWGGPLAGIAASFLVLAVFVGNAWFATQKSEVAEYKAAKRVEAPAPEMPSAAAEGYTKPGPAGSLSDELLTQGLSPELEPADRAKEKDSAESVPLPEGEALALNGSQAEPPVAEMKRVAPAEAESRLRKQEEPAMAPAAPAPGVLAESGETIIADNDKADAMLNTLDVAEQPVVVAPPVATAPVGDVEVAAKPAPEEGLTAGRAYRVEISEIEAVLVVDPSQASMQVQSQALPTGGLDARVEEAQRLAGGRPLIALYTIATGDARRDFAQVPLQTGLTQQLAAPPPLVGLLGVQASQFDFIALPEKSPQ
jgi:hypothetical protein